MDANVRLGYLAYNLALLVGTVLRRMFPQILLMSTFTLVAVLIIYISFENPDLYLSDMSCLFNKRGLTELLNPPVKIRQLFWNALDWATSLTPYLMVIIYPTPSLILRCF